MYNGVRVLQSVDVEGLTAEEKMRATPESMLKKLRDVVGDATIEELQAKARTDSIQALRLAREVGCSR